MTNQIICLVPVTWNGEDWKPGDLWNYGDSEITPHGVAWAEVEIEGLPGPLILQSREREGEGYRCVYSIDRCSMRFKMDFGPGVESYMTEIPYPVKQGKPKNGEGLEDYTTSACYSYMRWAPCTREPPKYKERDYLRDGLGCNALHR